MANEMKPLESDKKDFKKSFNERIEQKNQKSKIKNQKNKFRN